MKIIVGLGNPGEKYKNSRHNAGFMCVDVLSAHPSLNPVGGVLDFRLEKKLKSKIADTVVSGEKIILIKPETFMNSSGIAISKVLAYYKAGIESLIVISDDADIPLGEVRIRLEGSSGGQKGLQNIIDILSNEKFIRLRIGIGESFAKSEKNEFMENNLSTKQYVLEDFDKRQVPILKKALAESCEFLASSFGKKESINAHSFKV